jgi:hypothetical protein
MTVLIGVAFVAGAIVLFILQPIVGGVHASLEREDEELTETEARKRVALLALRDVEYDFLAGKLDEEDYRAMKAQLTAEAMAALEADEAVQSGSFARADSNLEAEIAAVRAELNSGAGCPQCDFLNEEGSRFCSACGVALADRVPS